MQVGGGPRHPEDAINLANAVNAVSGALSNRQNLANGAFGPANPLNPVSAEAFGSLAQNRISTDRVAGAPQTTAERFVIIRNAARVTPIAAVGFRVQAPTTNVFNNVDQLLAERGILVSEQATPTLLNNVLSNVQIGIEQASFIGDSPGPADNVGAIGGLVVGGTIYQHTQTRDSNLPLTVQDFNESLGNFEPLFVNGAAGNFLASAKDLKHS